MSMQRVRRKIHMPGMGNLDAEGPEDNLKEMERRLQNRGDERLERRLEQAERSVVKASAEASRREARQAVEAAVNEGLVAYEERETWLKFADVTPEQTMGDVAKRREEERAYQAHAKSQLGLSDGEVV
jgi:hypothetical protein